MGHAGVGNGGVSPGAEALGRLTFGIHAAIWLFHLKVFPNQF